MKFNTLLNLLGAVADKYDIFKQEHSLAKECLSSLDKRRMGLSKSAPDSVQEWQSHCEQVKVRISCMSIQLLQWGVVALLLHSEIMLYTSDTEQGYERRSRFSWVSITSVFWAYRASGIFCPHHQRFFSPRSSLQVNNYIQPIYMHCRITSCHCFRISSSLTLYNSYVWRCLLLILSVPASLLSINITCINFRLETNTDKLLADGVSSLAKFTKFNQLAAGFDNTYSQLSQTLSGVQEEIEGAVRSQQTEKVRRQLEVSTESVFVAPFKLNIWIKFNLSLVTD